MPTATSYDFTIATSFPGGLATDRLDLDLRASSIVTALDRVDTSGGVARVWFRDVLSPADEATLTAIVVAHTGHPLPGAAIPVDVSGPKEADGKAIVVISPATEGMKTWLTGRGDDLGAGPAGRGKGTKLKVAFAGGETYPNTQTVDVQFLEPVEVHDGQFNWTPVAFDADDYFSVSVVMPGTTATSTPGTGNANEVALGGGAVLYVPAAGDGSHTIDLADWTKAVPVPADGAGYWNVDDDGAITPSATPGEADWHMVNFPSEAFLIAEVGMQNSVGLFDVDVYKTEWIHPAWLVRLAVTKAADGGACVASGWLLTFRAKVTRS